MSRAASAPGGDAPDGCPLCMEEMDASDARFRPCPCGYQVCRFCWHRIREEGNERCPACRRTYTDEDAVFLPASAGSFEFKKAQGRGARKPPQAPAPQQPANLNAIAQSALQGVLPARRHLLETRVIQKNLVYVIGLPPALASEAVLREADCFGQFGRILKVVVNRRAASAPAGAQASGSAYVTFASAADAVRAIAFVDGALHDGRVLRATFGTTKYCAHFLRGSACPNAGCMYLHEEGPAADSYTKEELSGARLQLDAGGGVVVVRGAPSRDVSLPPRVFGASVVPSHVSNSSVPPGLQALSNSPLATANQHGTVSAQGTHNPNPQASHTHNTHTSAPASVPPRSPPLPNARYEEDALSFLSRLARWEASADVDRVFAPERARRASDANTDAENTAGVFDPFAAVRPPASSGGRPPAGRPRAPSISLPGFDWASRVLIAAGAPERPARSPLSPVSASGPAPR